MDFSLSQAPVPFRMQPGLRRLAQGELQLTPLGPQSRLFAEKRAVVALGQARHCAAGFDPGPALDAIAREGAAASLPELTWEEDFAVLDGDSGTVPWLCVCVPSHWAPEEKIGLPLAAIHAPVADNAALIAASSHLVSLATTGRWERHVWTVTPSGRYDQHPLRHPRTPWPEGTDDAAFAAACWLRAERQTFFPVGAGTRQAVFTIRVVLQPLADALRTRADTQQLRDSLASMSDAVLAYKNLTAARAPLLRWLDNRLVSWN
jgi:hypothetical protein